MSKHRGAGRAKTDPEFVHPALELVGIFFAYLLGIGAPLLGLFGLYMWSAAV